jgi:hypothetical protein
LNGAPERGEADAARHHGALHTAHGNPNGTPNGARSVNAHVFFPQQRAFDKQKNPQFTQIAAPPHHKNNFRHTPHNKKRTPNN